LIMLAIAHCFPLLTFLLYLTGQQMEQMDQIDEIRAERAKRKEHNRLIQLYGERPVVVVHDRSKSKSARVKEEAKKKTIRVKPLSKDHKAKREHLYPTKSPFIDIVNQYQYDDRSRGRIVVSAVDEREISEQPLTSTQQLNESSGGIFGKGASSGQYIPSDKRLHNQTGREMSQRSAARLERDQTDTSISTSSDESDMTPSERQLLENRILLEKERALKEQLETVKELRLRSEIESAKQERLIVTDAKSECTSDAHSAHSREQRAKNREQALHHQNGRAQQEILIEGSQYRDHTGRIAPALPPASSPSMPNEPPPLLAFDGNRPHQHSNAWRGQHTRNEPDWREVRENLYASGGPQLPSSRPLDFLINDMEKINDRHDIPWEVLPGGCAEEAAINGAGYSFNEYNREWKQQNNLDTMQQLQVCQDEPRQHEMQDADFYGGNEGEWLDGIDTFEEYIDYNHAVTGPSLGRDDAGFVEFDMFDQEAYQQEDEWLDKDMYEDQIEPEEAGSMSMYDLRAAVQPTKDELGHDFWQPQQHY
jgi:hypothetical protein